MNKLLKAYLELPSPSSIRQVKTARFGGLTHPSELFSVEFTKKTILAGSNLYYLVLSVFDIYFLIFQYFLLFGILQSSLHEREA